MADGIFFRAPQREKSEQARTLAGSAIPREAWQTVTGVGGPSHVDTLSPLGYVTVVETGGTVVDGALVRNSFKHKVDTQHLKRGPRAVPVPF